ncbi:cathepsin A [Sesbania bispinosa]|nr:cathepsin A [Sesbania bispinosa]
MAEQCTTPDKGDAVVGLRRGIAQWGDYARTMALWLEFWTVQIYMEGDSDAMAPVTEKRAAEVSNRWWRRYLIVYGLFNRLGFHHKATLTKISSPKVAAQENFAIFRRVALVDIRELKFIGYHYRNSGVLKFERFESQESQETKIKAGEIMFSQDNIVFEYEHI